MIKQVSNTTYNIHNDSQWFTAKMENKTLLQIKLSKLIKKTVLHFRDSNDQCRTEQKTCDKQSNDTVVVVPG